jgi:hypothetical protein
MNRCLFEWLPLAESERRETFADGRQVLTGSPDE